MNPKAVVFVPQNFRPPVQLKLPEDIILMIAQHASLFVTLRILATKSSLYKKYLSSDFWRQKSIIMGLKQHTETYPPVIGYAQDLGRHLETAGVKSIEHAAASDPHLICIQTEMETIRQQIASLVLELNALDNEATDISRSYTQRIQQIRSQADCLMKLPPWLRTMKNKFLRDAVMHITMKREADDIISFLDSNFKLQTTTFMENVYTGTVPGMSREIFMEKLNLRCVRNLCFYKSTSGQERTVYMFRHGHKYAIVVTPKLGLLPPFFAHYLEYCKATLREFAFAHNITIPLSYDIHRRSYAYATHSKYVQGKDSFLRVHGNTK